MLLIVNVKQILVVDSPPPYLNATLFPALPIKNAVQKNAKLPIVVLHFPPPIVVSAIPALPT